MAARQRPRLNEVTGLPSAASLRLLKGAPSGTSNAFVRSYSRAGDPPFLVAIKNPGGAQRRVSSLQTGDRSGCYRVRVRSSEISAIRSVLLQRRARIRKPHLFVPNQY